MAFLVGVGYFNRNLLPPGTVLHCAFSTTKSPCYATSTGCFRARKPWSTYNGKSFDLPLLRTRFISNRIPFRLDSAAHFDLLHASRRFWKMRFARLQPR